MSIDSVGYFRLARSGAEQSTGNYRVGATVVKKRPLAVGFNKPGKTSPILQRLGFSPHAGLHAELDACSELSEEDLRGSTVYVYRLRKRGDFGLAKPCPRCMKYLAARGVRKVFYSTYGGYDSCIPTKEKVSA